MSETTIKIIIGVVTFIATMIVATYRDYQKKEKMLQCSFGDNAVKDIIKNCKNRKNCKNYHDAIKLFSSIPKDAWDQRYFYSVALSRIFSVKAVKKWIDAFPDSADAWLVYGAVMVQHSWNTRGYGRGYEVPESHWEKFYQALQASEEVLRKAASLNPKDPTPWAYLIMIATWNTDSIKIKYKYFDCVVQRDPENWAAHIHMVIALSEKWGGSHKQMYAFAREAANKARPGSDIPIVLIKAHLEYYKYLEVFEEDLDSAEAFRTDKTMQEESIMVYENSLGHQNHKDSKTTIFTRYNLSGWLWAL